MKLPNEWYLLKCWSVHKDHYHVLNFQVVESTSQWLLGVIALKIWIWYKREQTVRGFMLEECNDVLTGLGETINVTHHITVDPNVPPLIHPPRKLPIALRDRIRTELEWMETMNVFEQVHAPTKWVTRMVTAIFWCEWGSYPVCWLLQSRGWSCYSPRSCAPNCIYTSKSITKSQQKLCANWKEMLATVFGFICVSWVLVWSENDYCRRPIINC